jgi:CheY-like chemotaxis protein
MRTIVIAEDDVEVRRVVDEALASGAYRVFRARDGAKAWELIAQHRPDIVVLDMVLPKLGGMAVLERLRATPQGRGTRVIAVTRLHEPEAVAELRAAGAAEVLVKPFGATQVRAALDRALSA